MKNKIYILTDALNKKQDILEAIFKASSEQFELVSQREIDYETFDRLVEEKAILLERMEQVDVGFDSVFKSIKEELITNKAVYGPEIKNIQELIKKNMDMGSDIHMMEAKVKNLLSTSILNEKRRLSKEKSDGNAVMRYYQQANQNIFIEPAFLDQKK